MPCVTMIFMFQPTKASYVPYMTTMLEQKMIYHSRRVTYYSWLMTGMNLLL